MRAKSDTRDGSWWVRLAVEKLEENFNKKEAGLPFT